MLVVQLLRLPQDVAGKDEVFQFPVRRVHDFLVAALPLGPSFADEGDVLADAHHGVHVVGVDDGGDAVLVGDAGDELVYHDARLGVETRVGLVAEEVLGLQHNGARDGHTLLHAARNLAWELVLGALQIDARQAVESPPLAVFVGVIGEHVEGEHHVVEHRCCGDQQYSCTLF